MLRRTASLLVLGIASSIGAQGRQLPGTTGDFVIRNFKFATGEVLPEFRLHYRTLGQARRDAAGVVRNGVLIMHGTTGSGGGFLTPIFAGELFGAGQPLDTTQYFVILP